MKMSIKTKKRKVSQDNIEIPLKISKEVDEDNVETINGLTSDGPDMDQDFENSDSEETSDNDKLSVGRLKVKVANYDKPIKNMRLFRANLQKHFSITDVHHFVNIGTKDSAFVKRYLRSGGRILELAQLIGKIDKNNDAHVALIFSAIQINLFEIMYNQTELILPAMQGCNYLIKNYKSCIENLINSPSINHNKIVVKLITAMVTLDNYETGKTLINVFDLITENENLKKYLSHPRVKENVETLRTVLIHFLLSYMIEGNANLIRKIMEKKKLITSIVTGLVYDSCETVVLIIETMSKFILKLENLSKTEKVHFFDLNFIMEVTKLYNWQGPNKLLKKDNENMDEDLDDKNKVRESVHDFLTILLTSRKHGIAIQALTDIKHKRNFTQKRVLLSISKFWYAPYYGDLIISILQACPELFVFFYEKSIRSFKENPNSLEFLIKLTSKISTTNIYYGKNYIKLNETTDLLISMFFAPQLFEEIQNFIENDNFEFRFLAKKLLYICFNQIKEFYESISNWGVFKEHELSRLKFELSQHVSKYCSSIDTIIASVYKSLEQIDHSSCNILDHLEVTLDLLHIIYNFFPLFIEKTTSIINYIRMLKPIFNSSEKNFRLELKMINFILEVEPESISPPTKLFDEIFLSFIQIYVFGEVYESNQAKLSLVKILKNTGLFENGEDEIDLWLFSLKSFNQTNIEIIATFLIRIIKQIKENYEDNQHLINNITDVPIKNIKDVFYNIENEITVKGITEIPNVSNIYLTCLKSISKRDKQILEYLKNVSFYLYYYIPYPEIIENILIQKKSVNLQEHIVDVMIDCNPILIQLKDCYLNKKNQKTFIDIFEQNDGIEFNLNNEEVFLNSIIFSNDTEVINLIYFSLNSLLCDKNSNKGKMIKFIINFIHTLRKIKIEKYLNLLKYILCNQYKILQNFHIDFINENSSNSITTFLVELLSEFNDIPFEYTYNFRNKIINEIKLFILNKNNENEMKNMSQILFILNLFKLNDENSIDILKILLNNNIITTTTLNNNLNIELIIFSINRLSIIKKLFLNKTEVKQLFKIYKIMIENDVFNLNVIEKYENEIYNYLINFPHSIEFITNNISEFIFNNNRFTKNTSKIFSIILERNYNLFSDYFIKLINKENILKKELFYPILNQYFIILSNDNKKYKIKSELLTEIYNEYKNGIIKSIEKPSKSGTIYKENVYASLKLIEYCMPINECVKFINHKSLKLDSSELFQCILIKSIHDKVIKTTNETDTSNLSYINFINIWIHMMNIQLKKDIIDECKIVSMILIIFNWITTHKNSKNITGSDKILSSQHWIQFCKQCLKFGMKLEQDNSVLLKILSFMCDLFYNDDELNSDPETLFQMALSHSNFFPIILSNNASNLRKLNLVYLLYVLVKKNVSVVSSKHIPVYLGGYSATLSNTDQYILALIKLYEKNNISLKEFRPFIWGETAITHYSLGEEESIENKVILEPPMNIVQALFDPNICENSIENYPVWRQLDSLNQLPQINFDDYNYDFENEANLKEYYLSLNFIEKLIYSNNYKNTSYDRQLLKISPTKNTSYDNIYDPAFYIPLMSLIFAPESFSYPSISAQNGSLGLLIAAMSSIDVNLRLAAGDALLRYRNHFENNRRFIDQKLWTHLFDTMQNGLGNLSKKQAGSLPRIPFPSCLFLAKLTNIMSYPTNSMYAPLTNFLLVNNCFEFSKVPEFNILFQSSDVKHVRYRYYILHILKNGIKTSRDFELFQASFTLKSIMGFFSSSYSDKTVDLLILSVINNCVKIPKLVRIMIDIVGVISWLGGVVEYIESFKYDTIDGLVNIISNIWHSIVIIKNEFLDRYDIEHKLLVLQVKLLPKLSQQNTLKTLSKFINILVQISKIKLNCITQTHVDHLLDCCKNYFGDKYITEIEYIQKNGSKFIANRNSFVKKLKNDNIDELLIFTVSCLRELVINTSRSIIKDVEIV